MRALLPFSSALFFLFVAATSRADDVVPIRNFDIPTIEKLGRQMREQDALAATATDIIFQQHLELGQYPVRGWVVSLEPSDPVVTFVGENGSSLYAIFEVRPSAEKAEQFRIANSAPLSDSLSAQFRARRLALREIDSACSKKYNTIALRDPERDGFLVYAIAATEVPDAILVGGHYRFTIDAKGERVEQRDRLSRSCLIVSKSQAPNPEAVVGAYMSHIVSDTPIETHVFLNLQNGIDFLVVTPDKSMWVLHTGKISKKSSQVN